eukprot:2647502-Prymnesium_polylepis.1
MLSKPVRAARAGVFLIKQVPLDVLSVSEKSLRLSDTQCAVRRADKKHRILMPVETRSLSRHMQTLDARGVGSLSDALRAARESVAMPQAELLMPAHELELFGSPWNALASASASAAKKAATFAERRETLAIRDNHTHKHTRSTLR